MPVISLKLFIVKDRGPVTAQNSSARYSKVRMIGVAVLLPLLALQQVRVKTNVDSSVHELTASTPICDLSASTKPILDGVTILSLSVSPQKNYTTSALNLFPPFTNLNFFEVNIHLAHSNARDDVLARVWLPERNDWNV